MCRILTILFLCATLSSFAQDESYFSGKIVYSYKFTDLKGEDIGKRMGPYFGNEQRYYIDGKNYKSYDEGSNRVQLYNSETNTYYNFFKNNTAQKIDASTKTSKKFKVKKLDLTDTIAGYACEAIEVETDAATTVYYYCPQLKTDKKAFTKHNYGEWNKYLEATDGALTLKFVVTNKKGDYIWTATAKEVTRRSFESSDFAFPENVKLRN